MIIHTIIYRFANSVSEQDRDQFFTGLRALAESSDLIEQFGHGPHIRLPVDDGAQGVTADAIAQFSCRTIADLRTFSELPHVHGFISQWRSKITYDAAYANHEDLLARRTPTNGATMHHTEHTVTVEAPVDVVWGVLADVEGYAKIFPPTQQVTILEESPTHQIARLVVEVSGANQSWVSRRDLDADRHVIAYQQLEKAPLMGHMGGEWRALPLDDDHTQLVLTHDFVAREPVDGKVAGKYTYAEADEMLQAAVERNSVADLAAVKTEAERITAELAGTAA
ncbi:aromatase/cyclase [Nocardia ninae]|uniref:Coenzyme Q-binding protein COQ10 START domain-containing protein n=1 Tax=Nocardia ninae NBRC 108245 TaxID=1210091 RepID=A0A511M5Z4_9NOCA|nr:aromatase/cyclase [Nocardia ninae]GEM36054.1 hypothetical protein NN4_05730 [Nocardia ninae NBRC 108245]